MEEYESYCSLNPFVGTNSRRIFCTISHGKHLQCKTSEAAATTATDSGHAKNFKHREKKIIAKPIKVVTSSI